MHYFIDTFGSLGHVSFPLGFEPKKVYGYPQKIMLDITDNLLQKAKEKNIKTEFIHCFLNGSIKGVVFPEIKKGILNILPYEENGLNSCLDSGYRDAMCELDKAKKHFENALAVHDKWEKYYIDNIDFSALDSECSRLKSEILDGKNGTQSGEICDRFLGAATSMGAVDYIESLTENIDKRYFIKGRPGTGKSTFMKKIINEASSLGFDVQRYHCAFDPKSIDMFIIRELSVCVFDSTAPHEHFPNRENDEIIDFYNLSAKRNVDEEYKETLAVVAADYKSNIGMATACIKRCNDIFAESEKYHANRIDRDTISHLGNMLATELLDS